MQAQSHSVPQGNVQSAAIIEKTFLNTWIAATYCCCCDSWSLASGMAVNTILGLIVYGIWVLIGILIISEGYFIGILVLVISCCSFFFIFQGNRGAAELNNHKFRLYYLYSCVTVITSAMVAASSSSPDGVGSMIVSAIINAAINTYILYFIWSFYVRLEVGDVDLLKFGPTYIPPQHVNVVQGQVVQGGAMNQAPIYNANVGAQGGQNAYPQGGYAQGGQQGAYAQGGQNAYSQGGYSQGGQQGTYAQGGYPQSAQQGGVYAQANYPQGGGQYGGNQEYDQEMVKPGART